MRRWFFSGSFSRAILFAMLFVALAPIGILSLLFHDTTTGALTGQMEQNLQSLVASQAHVLDLNLQKIVQDTQIAADHARLALQREVSEEEQARVLAPYQPDARNVLGLDVYYQQNQGESRFGDHISNVYWNNDFPLTNSAARQIAQTSTLDELFRSIKAVNPESQWIYVTTPDGMMRLYPWASNDHYPDGWNPTEIVFYTVAAPENNPTLEPRWTPPYVDFAGAGWMVTLSMPLVSDEGEMLGVLSHDVTLSALKQLVQDIHLSDGAGFGFLIDAEGNVISHPDFQEDEATEGTLGETNLLTSGSEEFRTLVWRMTEGQTGHGYYDDENGTRNLLVYTPIPTIQWSLGIVVPQTEVVAPVTVMRERTLFITFAVSALVVTLAILMTQALHHPLAELLFRVRQLSESGQVEALQVDSFREIRTLAQAFNEMADRVWQRERRLEARVRQLNIQIDQAKRKAEVQSIVETDYFKHLEQNAARIRADLQRLDTAVEG